MSLAADFLWNWNTREANAAFGYDYILRQCRLRGRIDTDGKVSHLRGYSRLPMALALFCLQAQHGNGR